MSPSFAPPAETEEAPQGWEDKSQAGPLALTEDTSPRSEDGPNAFAVGIQKLPPSFGEAVSETSQAVRFHVQPAGTSVSGSKRSPLHSSFDALATLRTAASDGDWIDAARVLKSDAVAVRETSYSRHSSVLLALADALIYTDRSETPPDVLGPTFDRALAILSEPFIPEPDEEAFLGDLVSHGWNLVPAASNG